MKERNEGSDSDVSGNSVSSGEDKIIYKGPLKKNILTVHTSKVEHSRNQSNVSMTGLNEQDETYDQNPI